MKISPSADTNTENVAQSPDWSGWLIQSCASWKEGGISANKEATRPIRDWLRDNAKSDEEIAFRDALRKGLKGNAQLQWIKGLLSCGADPSASDEEGQTVLMALAQAKEENEECARTLLPLSDEKATRDGCSALMFAVATGKKKIARLLMDRGDLKEKGPDGLTLLMLAAESEDLGMLALLLPHSDPNERGVNGRTALMQVATGWAASIAGDFECVDFLLPVSDLSVKDDGGLDVFGLVVDRCAWACAEKLAPRVGLEELRAAVKQAPAGAMPRAVAEIERQELAAMVRMAERANTAPQQNSQESSLGGDEQAVTSKNRRL